MDFLNAIQHKPLKNVKEILCNLKEIPLLHLQELDYEAVKTAVTCKREDVLQLLLEKNYRVNESNDTPLHTATKLGNIKFVKMLLERGASITLINKAGDTPLHIAFQNKQMEIVDLMLNSIQESSNYLNVKNKQDLTHLDIACTRASKAVVDGFFKTALDALENIKNHTLCKDLQSNNDLQSEKIEQESVQSSEEIIPPIDNLPMLSIAKSITEEQTSVEPSKEPTSPNNDNPMSSTAELVTENSSKTSDSDNEDTTKELELINRFSKYTSFLSFKSEDSLMLKGHNTAEFHIVCGERHPDVVRHYVREGWDVNAPLKDLDWNGYPEDSTPLHCAIEKRHADNVKVLLELGADAMLKDENGATPLHVALYNDDPRDDGKTLNLLYEATRDKSVNLIEKKGMSFLHVAASRNDLETVKLYLDQGANVNQKIGEDEYYGVSYFTPLHFAVQYRHQEMVELLLEHGANVNSPSVDMPLHLACEFGHEGIIELLMKKGARADAKAGVFRDKTTLHLLLEHIADHSWAKSNAGDCKDEQEAFDKDFDRKLSLFHSCFKKLIAAGCDINAKDNDGNTALHYACATQLYNIISVKKLFWLGADINVENNKGKTPLEMRKFEWYQDADDFMVLYHHVQQLKALGMKVNPKNEEYCKKIMEKRTEWSKNEDWEFNGQLLSDEELAKRNKQRLDEIEKMKKIILYDNISLYDFVRFERTGSRASLKNEKLKMVLIDAFEKYPEYWWRIWIQWHKAVKIFKTKFALKRKNITKGTENSSGCKRPNV